MCSRKMAKSEGWKNNRRTGSIDEKEVTNERVQKRKEFDRRLVYERTISLHTRGISFRSNHTV